MKYCPKCRLDKSPTQFHKNRSRKDGLSVYCTPCLKKYYAQHRQRDLAQKREFYASNPDILKDRSKQNYRKDIQKRILYSARKRASKRGIPFDLTLGDIHVPATCPVLGIELAINFHKSKENSPSLDRIVPSKGYVKGNVLVISMKANQIKTNANLSELKAVYDFYKDKMP